MSQASVLRDRILRVLQGGLRVGKGGTNYMTISTTGGIVQYGSGTAIWTGAHTFASTVGMTGQLSGGAASLTSTLKVGGVTTLTGQLDGGAASLTSTLKVGGAVTLSDTAQLNGVATFAAAPVLSGSGRPTHAAWVPACEFNLGASAALAVLNSKWNAAYFTPAASSNDITVYAQVRLPTDFDTSYGLLPRVYWSRGAAGASAVADWILAVDPVANNEATSSAASNSSVTAGASLTSGTANAITGSSLSLIGATSGFTAGDMLSLALKLDGGNAKTTAGCPYLIGVGLEYKASTL